MSTHHVAWVLPVGVVQMNASASYCERIRQGCQQLLVGNIKCGHSTSTSVSPGFRTAFSLKPDSRDRPERGV